MKGLKKRLFIAFFLIVSVPIILIVAFGTGIVMYQASSIEKTYEVEGDTLQVIANPMRFLSRMTNKTYQNIKDTCTKEPEKLLNTEFLEGVNRPLLSQYSFLTVIVEDSIYYAGDSEHLSKLQAKLPSASVDTFEKDYESGFYVYDIDRNAYLVKLQSFVLPDGRAGIAYIITDVDNILPQLRMSAIQSVIAFGAIILITAGILVIWLYRSVLSPILVLTEATQRMQNGDLDFSVSGNPDDELGRLCEDFEEMRVHLKELIDEQKQAEKDSTELISNISHDLKTPITAIKGYAEGLLDGVANTDEMRERYVKTIYNKASVMAGLVDELSYYTKTLGNKIPYNFSHIDVDAYFADCIEELSLDMELKNVTLKYSNDCKPHTLVNADPEQIKRVIGNIIGNALKYMNKPEGELELRLKSIGNYVQIEIADNGAGIASEDLPLIFDRFYRTDSSRNSKQGGTGLGLAIVKKIIEDHNGQIWALSELGEGTTIIFTIPKYIDDKESEEELAQIENIPKKVVRFFGLKKERRSTSEEDTDN